MVCSLYRGLSILALNGVMVIGWVGAQSPVSVALGQENPPPTSVTLRWGARPGVSRYRLQLANDGNFADIVFDRVVSGHQYSLNDLPPGRYFWRVAALNARLGEFSSAGVIDIPPRAAPVTPTPTPKKSGSATETLHGVWYAAIGDVASSIVANLRSPSTSEIVAFTTDRRIVALDADSGIALWTFRPRLETPRGASQITVEPITVPTPGGRQNVAVFFGNLAMLVEGKTGRELWRTTLPAPALTAVVSGTRIFVVDTSLRKLFLIDANAGKLISESLLPQRAVGSPVAINFQRVRAAMIALEDGGLHVVDESGKAIASSNAGSAATTAPLLVRTTRGDLVLVGTRSGLTALTADELRPLGRVSLNDDTPRGTLHAPDLEGDGRAEVVMFTDRGRVAVVNSDEGRIVWQADARRAQSAIFRDLNGDRTLDLIMPGGNGFAFALSGRVGSVVWQDDANAPTNHVAAASPPRLMLALPTTSGMLLVIPDRNRVGLRALEFPKQ
jgi:outer membrane protein assembly factor BamB